MPQPALRKASLWLNEITKLQIIHELEHRKFLRSVASKIITIGLILKTRYPKRLKVNNA